MKGIFIYNKNINYENMSGIDKKVVSQVKAMNSAGLDTVIREMKKKQYSKPVKLFKFILSRLPWTKGYPEWIFDEEYPQSDFLYMRRPDSISKDMLNMLRRVKKENPSIKIIMEIPNYPYETELGLKWYNRPLVMKDRLYRNKLKSLIDRIAIQNVIPEIFGIKTILFLNGIEMSEISVKKPFSNKEEEISICAVASLEPWQGYERIINGLGEYYKNGGERYIHITIAGIGSEMDYYQSLVKENRLDRNIDFAGRVTGSELSKLYDEADLALDAFGRYKTGNFLSTSLKSREYLAKGIPIITGCKTDVLAPPFRYYLELSNNESIIDFNEIVNFYDCVYRSDKSKMDIIFEIRQYAEETCDIKKMMNPVIDYLLESE